jgi:polysaccharide export outer membrane protein
MQWFRLGGAVSIALALLAGCASSSTWLPSSGPSRQEVTEQDSRGSILLVEVTGPVARQLMAGQRKLMFSEALASDAALAYIVGRGDVLEVTVWEAPPALLFSTLTPDPRAASGAIRAAAFPEQMVSSAGTITVPFAGPLRVEGQTLQQVETAIAERLKGKANQPQVIVRLVRNASSTVTVVGEVGRSTLVPLTPRGERLLDALAEAGGVRQPVNKMSVQITRGDRVVTLPLETVIQDPRQNIPLRPGDVITALHQSLSMSVLGATGKNEEMNFESPGITLAQALARFGGVQDNRADAAGVFIFRFEDPAVFGPQPKPLPVNEDGRVPVVYRVDLKNPSTFFVAQSFPMRNRDVVYVANASAPELQKFLNVLVSLVYPFDVIVRFATR